MPNLIPNLRQMKIVRIDGEVENIPDVVQWDFFGATMIIDLDGGRRYLVKQLSDIKEYEVKGQPKVNKKK